MSIFQVLHTRISVVLSPRTVAHHQEWAKSLATACLREYSKSAMASFKCMFCGTPLTVPDNGAKTATCPNCMASLPVPDSSAMNEPVGAPESPNAVQAQKGFPFVLIPFVSPLAIMFLGVIVPMAMTKEWSGMVVSALIGGGLALVVLLGMRGRWTLFRGLWVLLFAGVWFAACLGSGIEKRAVQREFAPVQAEFAGYLPPPARIVTAARPIKLKLFPLFLHSRGKTRVERDAPSLPILAEDFRLYKDLPPSLRAVNAAEVQSVVIVDWGWDGDSRLGTCDVTVVDRKTRTILAATSLTQADTSTAPHAPDWRGTQPSIKDVLGYLQKLNIEAERTP